MFSYFRLFSAFFVSLLAIRHLMLSVIFSAKSQSPVFKKVSRQDRLLRFHSDVAEVHALHQNGCCDVISLLVRCRESQNVKQLLVPKIIWNKCSKTNL